MNTPRKIVIIIIPKKIVAGLKDKENYYITEAYQILTADGFVELPYYRTTATGEYKACLI
tara:strand:+ start:737 stop:916 length:180 start_codon:yes stop_codon:yes gene_type:complete